MTNQQGAPEALRLATYIEEMANELALTHYTADMDEAAAELRRLHTENTALQQGYAAARLEIQSLQARINTMAEEHADELMVAHMDGRMRAAQPAGAQQPGTAYAARPGQEVPSYSDDALLMVRASELRAFADATHALRASHGQAPAQEAPAAVAGPSEFPHEQMDVMDLARYKVMPSHESMLHRHVVVAGDGSQQLYIGREVECENMARKFAGAFLDGAFAFHSMLAAAPAQPAPQQEVQEPYSIDVDPQGIRALVADAITGALAFGAQGTNAPPDGHWLAPFWAAARAEREAAPVADLHPKTSALVQRFAAALTEKLAAAEKKYGYSDGWASPDWMGECRQKLVEHLAKGDPRDVAAYCAFLWHHRESTTAPASQGDALDAARYRWLREQRLAAGQGSITVELDDRANGHFSRSIFLAELDAAIDAALAAQEGK